ncbi:MAG TPA: DUF4395 family protein [Syntrophomonadaceae bacterium]|nr:DUF4395 family protein [Syntrophomonadaceae bacterium]
MVELRPVEVPNASFNFCKFTISILLWVSLILQSKLLVTIILGLLVLSAILKVRNAPLVFLYTHTLNRIFPSPPIILDENAVRFTHIVGAAFATNAVVFLYFIHPLTGWIITGVLAALKTSGAFGLCGAMKLYSCMNNPDGQCCRTGSRIKKYHCG